MTVALTCKIVFHANTRRTEDIVLHRATEIEIESTWKEMTDRGSLTLPRNVRFFDKNRIYDVFRRGDQVTVYFGYDGNNFKEFEGYIASVSADIPIVIKFEDEMFMVRKIPVNFSSADITLEALLKAIIPGYEIDALEDVQLGSVRLSKTMVGPALEKLHSDWGFYTYMRGKTVVCGKYYADDKEDPVNFNLERNCVSTSLNYRRKEDVSVKIKVTSTLRNGEKIEVENIGDKDGTELQIPAYGVKLKVELERIGKLAYAEIKVDKFEGNFTSFGVPSVRHGQKVNLTSNLYSDREGLYYVEKVSKKLDLNGIRQEISLGKRVTANEPNSRIQ